MIMEDYENCFYCNVIAQIITTSHMDNSSSVGEDESLRSLLVISS